jgi:hypothetical protein
MATEKLIESVDNDNNVVKVLVRKPTQSDQRNGSADYNKAFRDAIESGAYLRDKLNEHLIKQGVWSADKQKLSEDLSSKIAEKELVLKKGGIPLKKARLIAIDLKALRNQFRELIGTRVNYDNNTAEGQADNARFDYMICVNILNPDTKQRIFNSVEEYNDASSQPWVIKAATEIASMFYNIEAPAEDKFLLEYKMTNEDGQLINKQGHLIAIDESGVEKLIDKDGYYIAYDESGTSYRVNYSGEKVVEVETLPFLDDEDDEKVAIPTEEKKNKKKKIDTE